MAIPLEQLIAYPAVGQPTPAPAAGTNYNYGAGSPFSFPTSTYGQNMQDPNVAVQQSLEAMLNPNSSYIQQARQRGANFAQQRGGINSSIAAGASERAATEAALPLAQQAIGIQQARERTEAEDWITGQNFKRTIGLMPLQSSMEMLRSVQEYALADPALYSPEVVSGYSNFFEKNMNNILSNYFSNLKL